MRHIIAIAFALVACGKSKPSEPLPEAILGEWEVWCRTDKESTATCRGKSNEGSFKIFQPGGKLTSGNRKGSTMEGEWTLTGNVLVETYEGGGMKLVEEHRARIEDDRLVTWYLNGEFGAIYGRVGASFEAAPGPTTSGAPITRELGGVRYSIALASGYRLARDDNNRQRWEPKSGTGFAVDLSVSPRARTQVDGQWVTPPCNEYDYGGTSSSGGVVDGVERDTSIGLSICIEGSELSLSCSTEHTRGYLEKSEQPAALVLCKSLKITR